jgi:hypothetical protein
MERRWLSRRMLPAVDSDGELYISFSAEDISYSAEAE